MAGIAGILKKGEKHLIHRMLETISHRGNHGKAIFDYDDATIGMVWTADEEDRVQGDQRKGIFSDGPGYGHMVEVTNPNHQWQIYRDELGIVPIYYAYTKDGVLCFASEVKALMQISSGISELPPGCTMTDTIIKPDNNLKRKSPMKNEPEAIASELLNLLTMAITRRITRETMGSWLTGDLDSSAIATLARPWVKDFHTFTGGFRDAPDLLSAREVAHQIGSDHHEVIIDLKEILRILPQVIYHLESFDASIVPHGIVDYILADCASGYVGEVFSGEAGDEAFAGYEYLKSVKVEDLNQELIDITGRLHSTSFQRVDRCAAAHGVIAHIVFADPQLVEFALKIPAELKIKDGREKWILRKAMEGLLPENILWRPRTNFLEGTGVGTLLIDYANKKVSDKDFRNERFLNNGWTLNSKEELFYYRIFSDHFGKLENPDWMGRTQKQSDTERHTLLSKLSIDHLTWLKTQTVNVKGECQTD